MPLCSLVVSLWDNEGMVAEASKWVIYPPLFAATAEWSARTVAAVVNEVCSGTSESDFQKTLTFINIAFRSYIAGIF